MEIYLFYILGFLIVTSSSMVIISKNPIHSVLFLILAYINASGLFILLGAEFLALIFLIVYVGAVAILFIFTVMMLNLTMIQVRESLVGLVPISAIIGLIFFLEVHELLQVFKGITYENETITKNIDNTSLDWTSLYINISELNFLGTHLYTNYGYLIIVASLILLVAMVGAILLTLEHSKNIKRQSINNQLMRHHFNVKK